jgi:hypothetical protein
MRIGTPHHGGAGPDTDGSLILDLSDAVVLVDAHNPAWNADDSPPPIGETPCEVVGLGTAVIAPADGPRGLVVGIDDSPPAPRARGIFDRLRPR